MSLYYTVNLLIYHYRNIGIKEILQVVVGSQPTLNNSQKSRLSENSKSPFRAFTF